MKKFILNDLQRERYNLSPYDKIDTLLDLSFTQYILEILLNIRW